ncbi:MAG: helix-turn-helix domain-containing protein [Planctomycetota bacterium]
MDGSSINQLCRARRLELGLSQAKLANSIGANQSQISEFERGDSTALSGAKIARLRESLGIDEEAALERRRAGRAVCTNTSCPGNLPFVVGGEVTMRPRVLEDSTDRCCRLCGEILDYACPACEEPLTRGLNCPSCGAAYVAAPTVSGRAEELRAWASVERVEREAVAGLAESLGSMPSERVRE